MKVNTYEEVKKFEWNHQFQENLFCYENDGIFSNFLHLRINC